MLQRNIRRFWKDAAWRWWQKGSHLRSSHIITHCKHTAAHRSAIACNVFCINSALRAVCVADASSSSMIHICIVDAAGSESQDYAKHIARSIEDGRRCVWRKEGQANPAPSMLQTKFQTENYCKLTKTKNNRWTNLSQSCCWLG